MGHLELFPDGSCLVQLCMISFEECHGNPCRVLFWLYHVHHAMVMMSSSKSWPTCCLKMRYQTRSMKSQQCTPILSKVIPVADQTSRACLQSQRRCPLVSAIRPHASQVGSSSTPRDQRFALVGRIFRHAKVFSLFGIWRLQIFCQN